MKSPDLGTLPALDLRRVAIESVEPEIDCGRFAIKCAVGEDK